MSAFEAIAIIPARGGSKRIPRKNIRDFAGQPMLARAIRLAMVCQCFVRIVVSSDDAEILDLARAEGAETITRPTELADDFTTTRAVILHAIKQLGVADTALVCCLYPATPLLPPVILQQALEQARLRTDNRAVYAVQPFAHPPTRALYRDAQGNMVWHKADEAQKRTQDIVQAYHDAGQFYVMPVLGWQNNDNILQHGHGMILEPDQAVDIDNEHDWQLAELLFAARQKHHAAATNDYTRAVLFRADASHHIGSGHIMRCLTLAHWLQRFGYRSHFLCRDLPGQMAAMIEQKGHAVTLLPAEIDTESADAEFSQRLMFTEPFDWVVVDHYALGARWEAVVPPATKVMVIDDLADRPHRADLLLNQNMGSQAADYEALLPKQAKRLCGPDFALLRPEFSSCRTASLRRQAEILHNQSPPRVLINFGGMDEHNYTARVMRLIAEQATPPEVSVLIGAQAPHAEAVVELATTLAMTVHRGIGNVAQLLSQQDWVIGAAGSSLWERCALGVPSLLLIQADNQIAVAQAAQQAGIARVIMDMRDPNWAQALRDSLPLLHDHTLRLSMSLKAAAACDGRGVAKVLSQMIGK